MTDLDTSMFEEAPVETTVPKRRGRPRKKPAEVTIPPEQAVFEAQQRGEEVVTTKDASGQEFLQRTITLGKEAPPAKKPGARTKVYNKKKSKLFCSDTVLLPHAVGSILVSDLAREGIAKHVIEVK